VRSLRTSIIPEHLKGVLTAICYTDIHVYFYLYQGIGVVRTEFPVLISYSCIGNSILLVPALLLLVVVMQIMPIIM